MAGKMGAMWPRASIGPSSLRWAATRAPRSSNSVSSRPLRRACSSVSRTAVTQTFARSRSCPGASVVTCCRGSRRCSRRRADLSANSRSRSTRAPRNVRSATCGSRVRRLRRACAATDDLCAGLREDSYGKTGASENMGWRMGFEPTTAGITIRDSTVELPPPLDGQHAGRPKYTSSPSVDPCAVTPGGRPAAALPVNAAPPSSGWEAKSRFRETRRG